MAINYGDYVSASRETGAVGKTRCTVQAAARVPVRSRRAEDPGRPVPRCVCQHAISGGGREEQARLRRRARNISQPRCERSGRVGRVR